MRKRLQLNFDAVCLCSCSNCEQLSAPGLVRSHLCHVPRLRPSQKRSHLTWEYQHFHSHRHLEEETGTGGTPGSSDMKYGNGEEEKEFGESHSLINFTAKSRQRSVKVKVGPDSLVLRLS